MLRYYVEAGTTVPSGGFYQPKGQDTKVYLNEGTQAPQVPEYFYLVELTD
jgi:hypothetical protein